MRGPSLILASASPRRAELLRHAGVRFRVRPSEVRETTARHLAPGEVCLANAAAKARSVATRFPDQLVLSADTEVALGTRVFGKPASRREAAQFLRDLSGRTHQVITGVCLLCLDRRFRRSFSVTTRVTFQTLSDSQIAAYLRRTDPSDKAGAYGIQEGGELIIESLDGSLTNVVGLPLAEVLDALRGLPSGLRPL